MSTEEAFDVFDKAARRFLKMSGKEFLDKWNNGFFTDPDSIPGVMEVASLIPGYNEIK